MNDCCSVDDMTKNMLRRKKKWSVTTLLAIVILISVLKSVFTNITRFNELNDITRLQDEDSFTHHLHLLNYSNTDIIDTLQTRTTIQASDSNSGSNTNNPLLLFYVGPPKIASSSIQCKLYKYSSELNQDGYVYVGKVPAPCSPTYPESIQLDDNFQMSIARCIKIAKEKQSTGPNNCMENINGAFNRYRDLHQNIILVDETFSITAKKDFPWEDFKSMLNGWDVRVVVGYRRYFEWAMSTYSQYHRVSKGKSKLLKWPDAKQKQGRDVIHPKYFIQNDGLFSTNFPFTLDVPFYDHFNITLFNMNENDKDPVELFMCNILPKAFKTCHNIRQVPNINSSRKEYSNQAITVNYDVLAVTAYKKGLLLNSTLERRMIGRAARYQQEEVLGLGPNDFPDLDCVDDTKLNLLFQYSLRMEQKVFSKFHQFRLNESKHKLAFRNMKDSKKFCVVRAGLLLDKDKSWNLFFRTLGDGTPRDTLNNAQFKDFIDALKEK